jgi:hypothetical protein
VTANAVQQGTMLLKQHLSPETEHAAASAAGGGRCFPVFSPMLGYSAAAFTDVQSPPRTIPCCCSCMHYSTNACAVLLRRSHLRRLLYARRMMQSTAPIWYMAAGRSVSWHGTRSPVRRGRLAMYSGSVPVNCRQVRRSSTPSAAAWHESPDQLVGVSWTAQGDALACCSQRSCY